MLNAPNRPRGFTAIELMVYGPRLGRRGRRGRAGRQPADHHRVVRPKWTTITGLAFSTTVAGQDAVAAPATVTVGCIVAGSNPVHTVREIIVTVSGQLVYDTAVARTMQDTIRIRADRVVGTCPAIT